MDKVRDVEAKDAENPLFREIDFSENPLAQRILKEGLAIQDRFSAEPVYARTGKGYLKSVGVTEIAEAKAAMKGEDLPVK
jgi:hypothetical protein